MYEWDESKLKEQGYEIWNARINTVDLSMADHGVLTLEMDVYGEGSGFVFGGIVLGHGYVDADNDFFDGSPKGIEYLERIMNVVGSDTFNGMKDKYIRVASKGWGDRPHIIGNIIKDKWFDSDSFWKEVHE